MRVEQYLKLKEEKPRKQKTKAPARFPTKRARKSKPAVMSFAKHRMLGGNKGKNPRFLETRKRESEANPRLKVWIKDPKSITEVFK